MPLYEITGPDGKTYEIEGPAGATKEQVVDAIMYKLNASQAPNTPQKSGFFQSLKEGAIGAYEATKLGVSAPFRDEKDIRQDYAEDKAAETERNVAYTPFSAIPKAYEEKGLGAAVGTTYDAARDALGRSLPYMAPTLAGMRAGAALTPAVLPVVGPLAKPIGAIIGGIAGGTGQFAGTNIQRRINEKTPGPLVTPEVYGTALGQASLDTAATVFTLGGNLIAKIAGKPITQITEREVASLGRRALSGAGRGIASEMPTEVAQQILERNQAGLSLTSDDAYAEYGEAAAAAGVLGGVLGSVSGASRGSPQAEQRQKDLAASSAERARQDSILAEAKAEAEQTQYAGEERAADLAGKANIDAGFAEFKRIQDAAETKKQQVITTTESLMPELSQRLNTAFSEVMGKLDTIDGVKELLNTPEIKSDKTAQQELQQYLVKLKRTADAEKKLSKLSDTDIEYTALADVQDSFQKQFGVVSESALKTVPLEKLKTALIDLRTEQPGQTNKYVQKKFDLAEQKLVDAIDAHPETLEIAELSRRDELIKAREEELKLFGNDPLKRDALTGSASARAFLEQEQAKTQIPDEAFPVYDEMPEVNYEEKLAQLERGLNEQEAANFELDEQFQPDFNAVIEEPVNEAIQQVPAEQRDLFNQFDQPTAAALRGTPDTSGVSKTKPKRTNKRDAVPGTQTETNVAETEATVAGPLGDVSGATGRSEVGVETSEETKSSALNPVQKLNAVKNELDRLLTYKIIPEATYKKYSQMLGKDPIDVVNALITQKLGAFGYKSYAETTPAAKTPKAKTPKAKKIVAEAPAEVIEEAQPVEEAQTSQDKLVMAELGKLLKDKVLSVKEYRGYAETALLNGAEAADNLATAVLGEVGYVSPLTTKTTAKTTVKQKRDQAEKELTSEVTEAKQNEDLDEDEVIGYDDLVSEPYDTNDQYFESRKAKPNNEEARIQQLLKTSNELSNPDVKKILSQYDLSDFTYANYNTLEMAVDSATTNWINNGKNSGFDTENEAIGMYLDGAINDIQTENRRNSTLASRKSKAKKGAKPKDISGKLRPESTEPTTPELFAEKISEWFNPVWYKNAVKNGMINLVDGTIMDSDLPQAVKDSFPEAKALFGYNGKSYFFLKDITKGNELGVFLHEIGEHKGLDNLIGKDRVKQLANRVRQMAEGKGSAKEVAMAKQAVEMAQGQAHMDKEIIAYFGEIAVFNGVRPGAKAKPEFGKATAWINELWNSIKKAIDKLHLNPEKITDKDIVDMLYGAARLEMGAAQTFNEQVGEPVPNEPEILASKARNPALELSPSEAAARVARGLTVRPPPQRQTMKEKMQENMGMSKGRDEFFNRMGNAIIGPLFSIHRKATAYYGPESFYTKGTGRLLGSLMGQHSLNANNFGFEAIKEGGLEIEKKGFVKSIKSNDNIIALNQDYKALLNALVSNGVSEAVAYQQAANMILADRYKSLKLMGVKSANEFTKDDEAEGYALRKQHKALYDKWRNRYNAMRKNKIDFLVDSSTYTRKDAETLMNRLEYVPLYRVKDSEGADGIFMQGLLAGKQQQKLQFDTKDYDVADIMTNIATNEMWLYKKGIFNHTTNLLIDQVEEMGGGKHVKVKNPNDEETIAYLRNGELQYFKFDDPNDMAMLRAVPVINNWAVNQMRFLGGILRKGITLTPSFIYRQVWQDVERGWMQSGTNQPFHKMLGQSIREQAQNAKRNSETKTARALRSRGVIGAVEYQDSFENAIDELFGRTSNNKTILERAYKKLEYMEKLAQNSDMAARAIVYENAVAEGATEGEAALRAQMMLNYQHRGVSPLTRSLLSTIPFINTKIQSEWRLVEAIQGKVPGLPKAKARQLLALKVLKMATLSAAYAMMRAGDDDYEEASDEQRNRNFLINAGGVPLRIPVAPEYMLIKAGMEQLTRKAIDAEFYDDRKLGHAVASSIGGLLLGVDDVMPSVLRPLLENMTNYSFFNDRQLVGQSLQPRDVNLQFVEGQTSELAKFISNLVQPVGGNTVNVSPIKIDNFINGVFGTMGRDVLFTTNLLAESITGNERPELKLSQMPEIGTAFYNPEGSQRVADYYKVRDKVMAAYTSYRSLVKTDPEAAREYLEENRKLIALRGPVDAIGNRLEPLRARQNRILADEKLSDKQKSDAIKKITEQKNNIVTGPTKMMLKRME